MSVEGSCVLGCCSCNAPVLCPYSCATCSCVILTPSHMSQVERNFIHEKLKAITAYYGDVACTEVSASQVAASHEATV